MNAARALLSCAVVAGLATVGCVAEKDSAETLPPLGVTGITTEVDEPVAAGEGVAEGETFATPLTVEPTVLAGASGSSTIEPLPVGDWDGASFDVGRITGTEEVGNYPAISFDRYSYDDPQAGAIDAEGFTAEPVQYWWVDEPFFNISTTVRRFVLAPDVEVLVLAADGESRACTTPQPDPLPAPTWSPVEQSFVRSGNASRLFASLTYSDDGLVERIRFTRGC